LISGDAARKVGPSFRRGITSSKQGKHPDSRDEGLQIDGSQRGEGVVSVNLGRPLFRNKLILKTFQVKTIIEYTEKKIRRKNFHPQLFLQRVAPKRKGLNQG